LLLALRRGGLGVGRLVAGEPGLELLLGFLEHAFADIELARTGIELLAALLQPLQQRALSGRGRTARVERNLLAECGDALRRLDRRGAGPALILGGLLGRLAGRRLCRADRTGDVRVVEDLLHPRRL